MVTVKPAMTSLNVISTIRKKVMLAMRGMTISSIRAMMNTINDRTWLRIAPVALLVATLLKLLKRRTNSTSFSKPLATRRSRLSKRFAA